MGSCLAFVSDPQCPLPALSPRRGPQPPKPRVWLVWTHFSLRALRRRERSEAGLREWFPQLRPPKMLTHGQAGLTRGKAQRPGPGGSGLSTQATGCGARCLPGGHGQRKVLWAQAADPPRAVAGLGDILTYEPKPECPVRSASSPPTGDPSTGEVWGRLRRNGVGGTWQVGLKVQHTRLRNQKL